MAISNLPQFRIEFPKSKIPKNVFVRLLRRALKFSLKKLEKKIVEPHYPLKMLGCETGSKLFFVKIFGNVGIYTKDE